MAWSGSLLPSGSRPEAATLSLSPNSCSCHHRVPTRRPGGKGGEPPSSNTYRFLAAPKLPREDGRVVVDGSELGQVGDLASRNPRRLSQNASGTAESQSVRQTGPIPQHGRGRGGAALTQEDPSSRLTAHTVTGPQLGLHYLGPYQMALRNHHTWSLRCQRKVGLRWRSVKRAEMGLNCGWSIKSNLKGQATVGTSPRPMGSPARSSLGALQSPGQGTMPFFPHHPRPSLSGHPGLRAPRNSPQGLSSHSSRQDEI